MWVVGLSKHEFTSQRDRGKNRKHVLSKAPMRSARELLPAVAVPLTNWSFGDQCLTCCSSVSQVRYRVACSCIGFDGTCNADLCGCSNAALYYVGILSKGIAKP